AEALDERRVRRELGCQLLHRDGAVEGAVAGEVDLRHPAPSEPTVDLVAVVQDAQVVLSHGAAQRRRGTWRHRVIGHRSPTARQGTATPAGALPRDVVTAASSPVASSREGERGLEDAAGDRPRDTSTGLAGVAL